MYNASTFTSNTAMKDVISVKYYSKNEEKINVYSHTLGFVLGVLALILLILKAVNIGTVWHILSFSIYGASIVILFAASTIYHSATDDSKRKKFKIFDHCAIYLLIAGTYTPFCLVTLNGSVGWLLFGVAWTLAIIGIVLKIFFTGRYEIISTLAYVVMGWLIVFAVNPMMEKLPEKGLYWLIMGGILFTVGAVIYAIPKIKFNHAVFHVFVLFGSVCHFISVYFYVN